jgi:modulator of FtsH protease HflK
MAKDHDHNHDHDHDHGHAHPHVDADAPLDTGQLDSAGRSLAEALRISFVILKVIMVGIVLAFVATCFQAIGPQEQGILLRFGQIRPGTDGEVALKSGLHFILPYPIEELVKIPVSTKTTLIVNTFWYFQSADEILNEKVKVRPPDKLDPLTEGYCLTRGEDIDQLAGESGTSGRRRLSHSGNDYNIAHSKWQVIYEISDIRAFFRNVPVEAPTPGEVYYNLMIKGVSPILQACLEESVVKTLVRYSIDDLIQSKDRIPNQVRDQVQEKLNAMDTGIKVVTVTLTSFTWPRQVGKAFDDFINASQQARTQVSTARTTAQTLLNESAGAVAADLAAALEQPERDPNRIEPLWLEAAGRCQTLLSEAQAYKTRTIESAKSSADYFQRLLPEYRLRPELVVQNLYLEALGEVVAGADEKWLIPPRVHGQAREVRVMLNRDPTLKQRAAGEKAAEPAGTTASN